MRGSMADGPKWLCNQCGHIWRRKDGARPPAHCAKCGHRGWDKDRELVAELEGAK
jgi:rubrerythrin